MSDGDIQADGSRRYGAWAGNPSGAVEDVARCVREVAGRGRRVMFYQCLRKRGNGPGGLYCKQHAKDAQ